MNITSNEINAICADLCGAEVLTSGQRSTLIALLSCFNDTNANSERYKYLKMCCRDEQEETEAPQLIHLRSSERLPEGQNWQSYLDDCIDAEIQKLTVRKRFA